MTRARNAPLLVTIKAGETVWWCRCGKSLDQPLCDGSHAGTGVEPVALTTETIRAIRLCGCKRTANPPYCDGTHARLD